MRDMTETKTERLERVLAEVLATLKADTDFGDSHDEEFFEDYNFGA